MLGHILDRYGLVKGLTVIRWCVWLSVFSYSGKDDFEIWSCEPLIQHRENNLVYCQQSIIKIVLSTNRQILSSSYNPTNLKKNLSSDGCIWASTIFVYVSMTNILVFFNVNFIFFQILHSLQRSSSNYRLKHYLLWTVTK